MAAASLALGILIGVLRPGELAGQEVVPGGIEVLVTTDLAPDHWAMEALRRVDALGLLARPLSFRGAFPVDHAAEMLAEARAAAVGRGEGLERLTAGWHDRFLREYGGLTSRDAAPVRLLGMRAGLEGTVADGEASPGFGEVEPWRTGALPLDGRFDMASVFEVTATVNERIGLLLEPSAGTDGLRVRRADIAVRRGNLNLALGRQPVRYAGSAQTGLVLSGAAAIDRLEARTARPVDLPGVLGLLGPVSLDLFVSYLWDDERHEREPFFWGGNLTVHPFPRLGVAVHRAAMLGGRGYDEPVTTKTIIDMLIGRVANLGFENQIVSVEARLRLPTESWAPLTAYMEWGAEDAAGGWWDVPARTFGLESPAIPGAEALSAGAVYTSILAHCCGNPPWYRHHAFHGNWAVGDRPLGHPLGGEGWEWAAYGSYDRSDAGVRLDWRLDHRERTGQNLYVPGRMQSDGAMLRASWVERPGVELRGKAWIESGRGWTERGLDLGAHLFF